MTRNSTAASAHVIDDRPRILPRAAAARRLSVSIITIDRMIAAAALRAVRIGRLVYVDVASIEQVEANGASVGEAIRA